MTRARRGGRCPGPGTGPGPPAPTARRPAACAAEQGGFRADLHRVGIGVAEPLHRGLLGRVSQLAVGLGEQAGRHQGPGPLHREAAQPPRREQLIVGPGRGERAQGRRQVPGHDVHAAEIDPAEDSVQGEPVPGRDLPAAVQVGPGQPDVASLQVHEAAVVEHLDQVQRAGLGQQGHRLVVLPQRQVVAAAALEQQAALREQDRLLRSRDVLLSLVKQPEAGVSSGRVRTRPRPG